MKMEDQVCSLENAKKLAELGVTADSYFCWNVKSDGSPTILLRSSEDCGDMFDEYPQALFRAYTVAELGQMLPYGSKSWEPVEGAWCCCTPRTKGVKTTVGGDTEADSRTILLIWLLENGHIDADELNHKED